MDWSSCPNISSDWIHIRDFLLSFLFAPLVFIPSGAFLLFSLAKLLPFFEGHRILSIFIATLLISLIYSPLATQVLTQGLLRLVPQSGQSSASTVVLLGRGPEIGLATRTTAVWLQNQHITNQIYVSGDSEDVARSLLKSGISPTAIAGDSCSRSTAENALYTSKWLNVHHIKSITLITDGWQLARATRLFIRQGITVLPLAVFPHLSSTTENRLAIREGLAFLFYWLLGRL